MPIYMKHIKESKTREDAVNHLADKFEPYIGRKTSTHPNGRKPEDFDIHYISEHLMGGHVVIFKSPKNVATHLKAERVSDDLANQIYAFRN